MMKGIERIVVCVWGRTIDYNPRKGETVKGVRISIRK
jgi:hypothetical protein